jgi:uncharacterized protein YneF (UPF0154 family)
MTEQADYTGEIRTKRLAGTNITEDMLRSMHARRGAHYMGIIELEVDETREKTDGANKVMLTIKQVHVSMGNEGTEAHLRQLTRSMHQQQVLNSPDQPLPIDSKDDIEPKVEDVIAARRAHDASQPHVFDSDDNEDEPARCLLCGELEADELHVDVPTDQDDHEGDEGDEGDGPAPDDPAYEPHPFAGKDGYVCEVCDQPEDSAIHTTADEHAEDPVPVA